jgi:DNA-binding beta-propeller fold protein YncE
MSVFSLRFLTALCLCSSVSLAWAGPKLSQAWQVEGLATPESVLVHSLKEKTYVFVSLIDGDPSAVDNKGGIALIGLKGETLNKDWVTGLSAPKGMAAKDNLLYVSDINDLVVIDIAKAKVLARHPAAGSKFLNDVAVNAAGEVFISDTQTKKIYQLKNDKLEVFLENVDNANGLAFIESGMLVGAGKELQLVDKDKKITILATGFGENIDGIEQVKAGEFVISCWPGLVYYVDAKGQLTQLIDSRGDKINTADIGYDPTGKLVLVPNFFKNTVTAYQLVN